MPVSGYFDAGRPLQFVGSRDELVDERAAARIVGVDRGEQSGAQLDAAGSVLGTDGEAHDVSVQALELPRRLDMTPFGVILIA